MTKISWIYDHNDKVLTICIGAKPFTIDSEHCNFDVVLQKLKDKDHDDLEALLDIPTAIAVASNGKIHIENEEVFYNGLQVHNVLVDRILTFMAEGIPFEPLVLFLENLLLNPNEATIEEMYLFLESGKMPLTEDGCFLAYKKVDENLKSYHPSPDGTYLDHTIGNVVEMDRELVDTNRNNTCSKGLHFCALGYLSSYSGGKGRVVMLKIDPRNVCAIPSDYKNTKGRASEYTVVAEYDSPDREKKDAFDTSMVDTTGNVADAMTHNKVEEKVVATVKASISDSVDGWGVKPSGRKYYNVRKGGKFTKRT